MRKEMQQAGIENKVYKNLVRESERNGLVRKPRCRWDDNTKMDVKELVWKCENWIHVDQDGYN
jgi:hypothetical protein